MNTFFCIFRIEEFIADLQKIHRNVNGLASPKQLKELRDAGEYFQYFSLDLESSSGQLGGSSLIFNFLDGTSVLISSDGVLVNKSSKDTVTKLCAELKSPDFKLVKNAVEFLERILSALCKTAEQKNEEINGDTVINIICLLTSSHNPEVLASAAKALASFARFSNAELRDALMKNNEAVDSLVNLLHLENGPDVGKAAIETLHIFFSMNNFVELKNSVVNGETVARLITLLTEPQLAENSVKFLSQIAGASLQLRNRLISEGIIPQLINTIFNPEYSVRISYILLPNFYRFIFI